MQKLQISTLDGFSVFFLWRVFWKSIIHVLLFKNLVKFFLKNQFQSGCFNDLSGHGLHAINHFYSLLQYLPHIITRSLNWLFFRLDWMIKAISRRFINTRLGFWLDFWLWWIPNCLTLWTLLVLGELPNIWKLLWKLKNRVSTFWPILKQNLMYE